MSTQTVVELPQKQFHMILQGHVLDCLAGLPSDSVDCIVSSPPYWGLRDYKLPPTVWDADPKCGHEWKGNEEVVRFNKTKFVTQDDQVLPESEVHEYKIRGDSSCSKCPAWKGQLGLEPDFRLYVKHLLQITQELKRVLKPTGCLWLNLGDTYSGGGTHHGDKNLSTRNYATTEGTDLQMDTDIPQKSLCFIPQRVALAMIDEQGWILRNQVVWFKPNGMPSSVRDRFSNRWEPMFFFSKQPRYWFDLDAVRAPFSQAYLKDGRPPGILRQRFYSGSQERIQKIGDAHLQGKQSEVIDPSTGKPKATYEGFNERWKETGYPEGGKNPGDVFEITTEPHPFAHFAVYPDALVERPIKASCPAEVCVKCGKARERITESNNPSKDVRGEDDELSGRYPEGMGGNYQTMKSIHRNTGPNGEKGVYYNGKTLGWTSCSCNEPFKAGVVLDPFAGSGTTGTVAKSLGRSSIQIELNKDYIGIIKERMDWAHSTIDDSIEWVETAIDAPEGEKPE